MGVIVSSCWQTHRVWWCTFAEQRKANMISIVHTLLLAAGILLSCTSAFDMAEIVQANEDLLSAARYGQLPALKDALSKGAQINTLQKSTGSSALHLAARENRTEVVNHLIAEGCDTDRRDTTGGTALFAAATNGFLQVAQELVNGGCEVNAIDNTGFSALHYAAYRGRASIVDYLRDLEGTKWYQSSNSGLTPYMLVCEDESCTEESGRGWVMGAISDKLHCDGLDGFNVDCSPMSETTEEEKDYDTETMEL